MPTVRNTSFIRTGFRPYGETNPFAATQLSGLGNGYKNRDGLRGLGDMVPDGAVVTYQGQWSLTNVATQGASSLLAAVVAAVNASGLHVLSSSSSANWLSTAVVGNSFTVTLQIQVQNGLGFARPADVASIVDHQVYAASGAMPQSSGASLTSIPSSTPGILPTSTTDWETWLQDNAIWIGAAVLGAVLLLDDETQSSREMVRSNP